ncbi:GFA family protein [Uliginosibacterium sp. H1]|uniref:GFA family protein n=1 Tax=Uliginosibacterium sp. H1 TaxID=3114757 RepID=UPI002E18A110|nr:GFA family protein [Uliginosibacterium sp. H1]
MNAASTTYRGSCHCGRVAIEVSGDIDSAMACNCSMCQRRGSLLWFVPRPQLRLLTDAGDCARYTFNKHVIAHRFCPECGIHVFGEATDPDGQSRAAINIRCLEGIDLDAVPVTHFDGRAM